MKRSMIVALGMGAMLLVACAASGAPIVTVYTTESSFTSGLATGYYQEGFNYGPWLTVTMSDPGIADPQHFSGGNSWQYDLSSANATYGLSGQNMPDGGGAAASYMVGDTLTITFTGTLPKAVGGVFWATDIYGNFAADKNVQITLAAGGTYTYSDSTNWDGFTGFISDSPISSMSIVSAGYYATMDNLTVGTVPEPVTMTLLALGGVGMLLRRRQRA